MAGSKFWPSSNTALWIFLGIEQDPTILLVVGIAFRRILVDVCYSFHQHLLLWGPSGRWRIATLGRSLPFGDSIPLQMVSWYSIQKRLESFFHCPGSRTWGRNKWGARHNLDSITNLDLVLEEHNNDDVKLPIPSLGDNASQLWVAGNAFLNWTAGGKVPGFCSCKAAATSRAAPQSATSLCTSKIITVLLTPWGNGQQATKSNTVSGLSMSAGPFTIPRGRSKASKCHSLLP